MCNDYIELVFSAPDCSEDEMDVLSALLCEVGFESFVNVEDGLKAYIAAKDYAGIDVSAVVASFPFSGEIEWDENLIKGQDWNEEWEKNYFKPMVIADRCVIHSSFHTDYPTLEYEIIVDPKMAFGTGHHDTTNQMVEAILDCDLKGKKAVDVGTGTGILAMLASMRGADEVLAVEIDRDAYINAQENLEMNNVHNVRLVCGDASALPGNEDCHLLVANINRNIIIADLERYAKELRSGGQMFLSGFYDDDVPMIEEAAAKFRLLKTGQSSRNRWAILRLRKE
ncbi:MAG: 50S ribosomal protein L11 methyltransferase [Muribaculaceae bacterium]|nr:50S ribosomal protein L11 methyltransferase [Muribaculaceae bacterium]